MLSLRTPLMHCEFTGYYQCKNRKEKTLLLRIKRRQWLGWGFEISLQCIQYFTKLHRDYWLLNKPFIYNTIQVYNYNCRWQVVCSVQTGNLHSLRLPRSHRQFSLLSDIQFFWCQFGEFGIGLTNNLQLDILLYSHHLHAWYCIDSIRKNSVLITHGR